VLHERPNQWLESSLNDLCRYKGIAKPRCDSRASKAKAIVNIVRDPAPCDNGLNLNWVCGALASPDITSIAARFDTQVHSRFCEIPFSHLVLLVNGIWNSFISEFLGAMFNLSSTLAQLVRGEGRFKDALLLLLQASLFSGKILWLFTDISRHWNTLYHAG
jgi:hypothetical protein